MQILPLTFKEKRDRHSRIRARIEERRRDQMAEIKASTAKMWEEHSSGEDLVGLIQTENHDHNILVEPAEAEAGHVYGATLVRVDESSILKLRVPLDTGFVAVEEERATTATLTSSGITNSGGVEASTSTATWRFWSTNCTKRRNGRRLSILRTTCAKISNRQRVCCF